MLRLCRLRLTFQRMAELKSEKLLLLIEPSLKAEVQEWRKRQSDFPSLGEAVRRLLRQALDAEKAE